MPDERATTIFQDPEVDGHATDGIILVAEETDLPEDCGWYWPSVYRANEERSTAP